MRPERNDLRPASTARRIASAISTGSAAPAIAVFISTPSRGHGTGASSALDDLREGLTYVRSQRWIWVTLIASGLFSLFYWGPVQVLLPYIVRNDLDGGAGQAGRDRRKRGNPAIRRGSGASG